MGFRHVFTNYLGVDDETYLTARKAIRKFCQTCVSSRSEPAGGCGGECINFDRKCPLFDLRFGATVRGISPIKAIVAHCRYCSGSFYTRTACSTEKCPLFPFRFGDLGIRRPMTEEQKKAFVERVRGARRQS
jgi:hypothetical protein